MNSEYGLKMSLTQTKRGFFIGGMITEFGNGADKKAL
jgi:hypothetical protein